VGREGEGRGGGDEGGVGRWGAGVQGGRGYCIWEVQICAALCAASNKGRIAFDCGGALSGTVEEAWRGGGQEVTGAWLLWWCRVEGGTARKGRFT